MLFFLRWRGEGFDWGLLGATLLDLHWPWVLGAVCFTLLTYYGRALRWSVMIRPLRPHSNIWGLFSATAIGFTAIVFFGRAGELVRPYLIAIKERVPFSSQLAAWILERIYDLLAALLILGFALSKVDDSAATIGPGLQWVLKIGGSTVWITSLICLAVLVVLRQFSETMRRRLVESLAFLPPRFHKKTEEIVTAFVLGVEATKDRSALALLFFYTVVEWVLIAGSYFCLFRAFPDLSAFHLTDVLIFMGFVSFGSIVQIPGIGGGVQIMSIVVLTELFGMALEVSGGVAIMVWILTFVVITPVGLLLLFHEGLNWQKLKQLEAEASK